MGASILIVDDSVSIRQSVRFILEQGGYTVFDAADGWRDSRSFPSRRSSCHNGREHAEHGRDFHAQKIRETEGIKFVPVLVLTTESQGSMVDEGKKAGATGWIVKPFNNEKLLETIKKILP
jgi:two-component system chemotaxis response regulator CheY